MINLQSAIENAARDLAHTILTAVKGASLQELLALQDGTAPKRGRSAKAAKKTAKVPAKKKRKINYPKCSVPGCGKNRYARGNGMCGTHFKAAQASTKA
jgi:hypothetical protein